MPRTTKTITFSLLPERADRWDEVTKREGRPRSELLRKAVPRYIEDSDWEQIFRYGGGPARELSIGLEDVERLVEEYRTEVDSTSA